MSVEGRRVAASESRWLLAVRRTSLSEYLGIVATPLARRLQYHLLRRIILALLRVVHLLLGRRHFLALLVTR